jgi:thiamine kinase-like enzyme
VTDGPRKSVARVGGDIPVHHILRFNEHAASRAASAAGISPAVLCAQPGLLVLDFIEGKTFAAEDVRAQRDRCAALVKRVHNEMAAHLRGPVLSFNIFHILRDYAHALRDGGSRMTGELPKLLAQADILEESAGRIDLRFGHNDLLAANFIDDGARLWLVDWDYAGFNTPLFDLGGLATNNGFDAADETALLETYFETAVTDELRMRFQAMACASLLRETMWSMVSEIHSKIDFNYVAYTTENSRRFEIAYARFLALRRR